MGGDSRSTLLTNVSQKGGSPVRGRGAFDKGRKQGALNPPDSKKIPQTATGGIGKDVSEEKFSQKRGTPFSGEANHIRDARPTTKSAEGTGVVGVGGTSSLKRRGQHRS